MMKVRTSSGIVEAMVCPRCECLVCLGDMVFETGKPCVCRFCLNEIRAEKGCARNVKIELPIVIEWSMTPQERVDVIREMMGDNYFGAGSPSVLSILKRAIETDRDTAMVKLSLRGLE